MGEALGSFSRCITSHRCPDGKEVRTYEVSILQCMLSADQSSPQLVHIFEAFLTKRIFTVQEVCAHQVVLIILIFLILTPLVKHGHLVYF